MVRSLPNILLSYFHSPEYKNLGENSLPFYYKLLQLAGLKKGFLVLLRLSYKKKKKKKKKKKNLVFNIDSLMRRI